MSLKGPVTEPNLQTDSTAIPQATTPTGIPTPRRTMSLSSTMAFPFNVSTTYNKQASKQTNKQTNKKQQQKTNKQTKRN